jgi:molecular chaperone GrpE
MIDQDNVEAILEKFRRWLENARLEAEDAGPHSLEADTDADEEAPARDFGIIDLVEEFTALRHEVKLQTKSGRGLIEQTETTLAALKQAIEHFRSVEPKEAQAAWTAGKGLAEALADLDEAIDRGYREIERARVLIADEAVRALEADLNAVHRRRSWLRRRLLRSYHAEIMDVVGRDRLTRHELFDSFLEGYRLIQKRLSRAMAAERVEPIESEGQPVDPERMTVLEVVDAPGQRPGTVVKELRRGYTWRGRLVRYAEVQAARVPVNGSVAANGPVFGASEEDESGVEPATGAEPVLLDSD